MKVFNMLKYLSKRHRCDLLCFGKLSPVQKEGMDIALPGVHLLDVVRPRDGIQKLPLMVWQLLRVQPPSLAMYSKGEFSKRMRQYLEANNYDVVHYDIVNMAQYVLEALSLPSVHSPNDATSLVYFRQARSVVGLLAKVKLWLSATLLRRYERRVYPLFSKVHVVSRCDEAYLKQLNSAIDVESIPISSDWERGREEPISMCPHGTKADRPTIICLGDFGNQPIAVGLIEFLIVSHPIIAAQFPDFHFIVLGRNVPTSITQRYDQNQNIEFVQWVNDYRGFVSKADVVLVPDTAGAPGAKTRVVQAMSWGLPIVGSITGFEGIPLVSGVHGLVFQSMEECAAMIIRLLRNQELRAQMGKFASDLAIAEFSMENIGPKYESLYYDAINKHRDNSAARDV